ncbi:nucleotidyltransferase domain-containing protein [Corticibacter populi]
MEIAHGSRWRRHQGICRATLHRHERQAPPSDPGRPGPRHRRTASGPWHRDLHLFGSAVNGGLRPYSDIDLLVIVDKPPGQAERQALVAALLAPSAPRAIAHLACA